MLRKLSINPFFRKVVVSFFAIVGLLILLPNCISAEEERPQRAHPVNQCITLFETVTERFSAMVARNSDGCIEEASVVFYRSANCTGKKEKPIWMPKEEGFVYKSGIDGGCPEAIEAYHRSPACVTLTLKSGRKAKICW